LFEKYNIEALMEDVVVGGFFYLEFKVGFFEKSFKIRNGNGETKTGFSLKGNVDKMGILKFGLKVKMVLEVF